MSVLHISNGVTVYKALIRKCIIVTTITAILTISTSGRQRNIRPSLQSTGSQASTSTEISALYTQIRQRVTELEYSDAVAEDFVTMVRRWKTPRGLPVLPVLNRMLIRAREAYGKGQISREQLAKTEEKAVAGLCQSIKRYIVYRRDYFDLTSIIKTRRANCFGYAQVLCILSNSISLNVSAMNVTSEHVANMVHLSDGTMTVVDLIRPSGFLSERIITDSEFGGDGSHWRYKDKNHIERNDRIIHIFDKNELIGEIHFCRGTKQYLLGQGTEAIVHYDRAIELSPQSARAYNNRGGARLILSDHDRAISDFNKAIDLAPTYVSAYHNRANAYLDSEQYDRAISDYTRAIELDPQFVKAYFGRGFAHLALSQYNEAISDYTQAIKLNPSYARAYYTRAIGYAHLEEREKAVQDMQQAVALDQTLRADVQKASAELELNLKLN